MNILFLGVLLLFPLLIIVTWISGEIWNKRWLRILSGVSFLLITVFVGIFVGALETLSYNAWYGGATQELLQESLRQMEEGKNENVKKAFKEIVEKYQPRYENRARYDVLVKEAVEKMKCSEQVEKSEK
jgi:hypothetical protein